MSGWRPLEPKKKPGKRHHFTTQAHYIQSTTSRFIESDSEATCSTSGRQYREFQAPTGAAVWPATQSTIPELSSDEEEDLFVIRKLPVPPPKPPVAVNNDGWYDWQIPPSVSLRPSQKQSTFKTTAFLDQSYTESSVSSNPVQPVEEIILSDTTANEVPETLEIGFYDEFCQNLDNLCIETKSEVSDDSFTSIESNAPIHVVLPVSRCTLDEPAINASQNGQADSDAYTLDSGFQNVATSTSGATTSYDALQDPQVSESFQTMDTDDEDVSAIYYAATSTISEHGNTRRDRMSEVNVVDEQFADAEESTSEFIPPVEPLSSLEHSREQTRRLRLYSTLYAELARDPWQWHDKRHLIRDMFPRLEREEAEGKTSQSASSRKPPPQGASAGSRHDWELDEQDPPSDDSHEESMEEPGQVLHGTNPVLLPGLDTLTSALDKQKNGKVGPRVHRRLEGSDYCFKCRRHFKNTWRMQKHLADSRIHPYYCQMCTVDYSSFRELYMHYAEQPKCRPPELEFGPAMPFLQILADYQITGQKEAARLESSADAKEALSDPSLPKKLLKISPVQTQDSQPNTSKNSEPPACPICMVPLMSAKEVLATACGHVYCSSCILHYFSKERPNCPKCRTPVSKATLIPLELR